MMKKVISLLLALIMAATLVGCAETVEPVETSGPVPAETAAAPVGTGTAPSADPEPVVNTRRLHTALTVQLGNTNPAENWNIKSQLFLWNMFEGLIAYDEKTGEALPRIADTWELAADNTYIDFHINQAVTFHNGEKVTADDVLFSFDYFKAAERFATSMAHLASWEKIDNENVRINLTGDTTIPMLHISYICILNKANVEAAGENAFTVPENSIGTGPYFFTAIDLDGTTSVDAYPAYYRGEAAIKGIDWTYLTDSSTIFVALQTGQFDVIDMTTSNIPTLEADDNFYVNYVESTHNSFLGLNASVITDPLVRQAILYAVDNEQLLAIAYNGYGVVSNNMAETGEVGGGCSFDDYYSYNPDKAKELLLQAGYTQEQLDAGIPIGNIVAMSTNYYAKIATMLQEMLAKVGLKFEVTTLEQATVESLWYTEHSDECAIICHGDNLKIDSSAFYDVYILTHMNRSSQERWGYSNELLDIGAQASSEFDPAARQKLWEQFWGIMKDQAIYYSLFHRYNCYGATKDLNMVMGVNYYRIYDWSWNS